jgi:uncharacterized protein YdgA (DUF945 family)
VKKTALVIAIAALAALGASPWWLGARAERLYRSELASWSQPGQVRIEILEYRRGWLRSEARIRVVLESLEAAAAAQGETRLAGWSRLLQTDRIHHGPLPLVGAALGLGGYRPALAVIDSAVGLEADASEGAEPTPFLKARTVLGFRGTAVSALRSDPVEAAVPLGTVRWEGMSGAIEWPGDARAAGTLESPGFSLAAEGTDVRLQAIEASFDLHRGVEGLVLGDYSVSAGRMAGSWAEGGSFSLDGLTAETSAFAAGEVVHGSTSLAVEAIAAGGETFGPASLDLAVRNLDARSVARWQALGGEMQRLAEDPEALTALLEREGRALAPALLSRSPEVEITALRFRGPDGEVSARAGLSFDGVGPVDLDAPRTLLPRIRAQAEAKVPAALALRLALPQGERQVAAQEAAGRWRAQSPEERAQRVEKTAAQLLAGLVAQGLLEFDGGYYAVAARWAEGGLAVNGMPIPVP